MTCSHPTLPVLSLFIFLYSAVTSDRKRFLISLYSRLKKGNSEKKKHLTNASKNICEAVKYSDFLEPLTET